jgi:hypothetical protein
MRTGHAKGHATSTWGKETDARVSADGIGRSVQPTSIKREILGKVISPPFFSPSPSSPPSSDHRMEMLYGHSIGIGIWDFSFVYFMYIIWEVLQTQAKRMRYIVMQGILL